MPRQFVQTPIGLLRVESDGKYLTLIRIGNDEDDGPGDPNAITAAATGQLHEWFAGTRIGFDLPLAPSRTPKGPIHRNAILTIPYGDTASYGQLARTIGSSPRAVGQACRTNPFPIVIPCHRVLAAGGTIGHYSGGQGIITKQWLLDHERAGGAFNG